MAKNLCTCTPTVTDEGTFHHSDCPANPEREVTGGENAETSPIYESREAAERGGRPQGREKWKIFEVTSPEQKTYYVWAQFHVNALANVVRHLGFTVSSGARKAQRRELTAEERRQVMLAELAMLSEEEKVKLGLISKPAGKGGKK